MEFDLKYVFPRCHFMASCFCGKRSIDPSQRSGVTATIFLTTVLIVVIVHRRPLEASEALPVRTHRTSPLKMEHSKEEEEVRHTCQGERRLFGDLCIFQPPMRLSVQASIHLSVHPSVRSSHLSAHPSIYRAFIISFRCGTTTQQSSGTARSQTARSPFLFS